MASTAPRSVVGLLPADSVDWLRDPVAISVLGAIDIGISQARPGSDGVVEVPVELLLEASGSLLALVMLLSLLPEGFAELCGETPAGDVLVGESFLSHMAQQEATSGNSPERIFCRFRASRLMQSFDAVPSMTTC